ncbi:MAG: hypothetical protein JNL72_13310 [Flavipsychrobacter sp.]|nr:hypothetical protein [Flavipsychrobacter sp.]
MKHWKKWSAEEQEQRITAALKDNINYNHNICLGIPASRLDPTVFPDKASFLKDAPLLRCYAQNPNHIGCHTLGESEPFFKGTQEIERETIELLSVDFFRAEENSCDGYIAGGGTEANIQAIWIYRNYFAREHAAQPGQVGLLCSRDTHYSMAKAANLLQLPLYEVQTHENNRSLDNADMDKQLIKARKEGIRYMIVVANMGTTMFGSVDDPSVYTEGLHRHRFPFRMHVDGAFGGFIYPTSEPESTLTFANADVSSITLDAHKMLQAPYGTGIFLARKGLMQYVLTEEATYVNGHDITLSGSRSGTNAVAIWMILVTYGPFGWLEKINKLLYRTTWLCGELDKMNVRYYRHARMNIVTIDANCISPEIATSFGLVPDTHGNTPAWYKIVVMDHVELDHLQQFLKSSRTFNS